MLLDDMEGYSYHQSTSPMWGRTESSASLHGNVTTKKWDNIHGLLAGCHLQQGLFATMGGLSSSLPNVEMETESREPNEQLPVIPMGLDDVHDANESGKQSDSILPQELPELPFVCEHHVTSTTAWICWTGPFDSHQVRFYQLLIHEAEVKSTGVVSKMPKTCGFSQVAGNSIELRNLTANMEYVFRVRAVNIAGPGHWCRPYKFATLAAAGKRSKPGPVTIIVRRKRGSQKNVAYFDGNGKDTVDGIKSY
ncbi:PREDICTED: fibronectin type III domain-containing protein 8 [Gavialis gangeticus]|uniref:fibronectin type III domain-containing protein 8 n=1 Tax=Gavialis gangeticus TaxID=94835 RepID=UPI00092F3054|nr:PREDICTED: fibronectin type III domain-containing protein 8 [Gavialis gangeticus]